jgi:hypothetical protein
LLLLVILELASFVLFYAATGRRFSYERVAQERAAEVEASSAQGIAGPVMPMAVGPPPPGQAVPGRPESTPMELVPHPFIGFVYDPEITLLKQMQGRGALEITELGFLRIPEPPGEGDQLSVAIFGGSVGAYFCMDGREAMARALAASPALRGRRVHVECFALGGFKQPQMVGALSYLLALGNRFDEVIELDGFNEVGLSLVNYKEKGTFPAYPRDWDRLVGQVPDVEDQRRIGAITYLQEWRSRLAGRFSRAPWRWSVTAAVVWKSLNRWVGSELARARESLARASLQRTGYRERGPLRHYGDEQEMLKDVARVWGLSSLQMQRLCVGGGMRYHHFLQPNQYFPGSKPMDAGERSIAYRPDHIYRRAVEQGYPVLQVEGARLTALGVDFHDLSSLFAAVKEPLYIDDCCHVNAKGNALMGESIGKTIVATWNGSPHPASSSGDDLGQAKRR